MSATLLLIDDNPVQAATRQTILRRAGYNVITVLDPSVALEKLQTGGFAGAVDLVVTDHLMPEMNGKEFVLHLREFAPTLPVLVISGMEEAQESYQGLHVSFHLKPLLPDHLLAIVHGLTEPATPRM